MHIKSLAHLAHERITTATGAAFKRSHFYELTAAAFGYASYAALSADAILFDGTPDAGELGTQQISPVRQRCSSLGYIAPAAEIIAMGVCELLRERQIGAIRLEDLVQVLRQRNHDDEWDLDKEGPSGAYRYHPEDFTLPLSKEASGQVLLESLQSASRRPSALAHYAIALLHEPDRFEGREPQINPYWHRQRQAGAELVGVQIEWADAYERQESSALAYEIHLRAAAKLGYKDALLDLAEHFRDPAIFDKEVDLSDQDAARMAELAGSLGRPNHARRWLTVAAEAGDTEAMRDLVERGDSGELPERWKWVYLAKLHGADLTADQYRAIHEDGSDYDDDVGGPMYAEGRDGIELEPLAPDEDRQAQLAAQEIYVRNGGQLETSAD